MRKLRVVEYLKSFLVHGIMASALKEGCFLKNVAKTFSKTASIFHLCYCLKKIRTLSKEYQSINPLYNIAFLFITWGPLIVRNESILWNPIMETSNFQECTLSKNYRLCLTKVWWKKRDDYRLFFTFILLDVYH